MSSVLSGSNKEAIRRILVDAGVYRAGFARVGPVDGSAVEGYRRWIDNGLHGEMDYMERYGDVRDDPSRLLEGARTVISCAFNYYYPVRFGDNALKLARYALGDDYHEVVREHLSDAVSCIKEAFGGEMRVCVDTAPLRERYWAMRAGVGFIGRNGHLIIHGAGSYFFLGEIITTLEVEPDEPCRDECDGCGACVSRCPGGALRTDGTVDARRCVSCLTIEHRGEFNDDVALGDRLYGCDVCQEVCPHNACPPMSGIPEFRPRPELLHLDRGRVLSMIHEEYCRLFRRSAIKRAKLAGLQRNARHCDR